MIVHVLVCFAAGALRETVENKETDASAEMAGMDMADIEEAYLDRAMMEFSNANFTDGSLDEATGNMSADALLELHEGLQNHLANLAVMKAVSDSMYDLHNEPKLLDAIGGAENEPINMDMWQNHVLDKLGVKEGRDDPILLQKIISATAYVTKKVAGEDPLDEEEAHEEEAHEGEAHEEDAHEEDTHDGHAAMAVSADGSVKDATLRTQK